MDDRMHDRQPCKRIRLEHILESGIISYSSSQDDGGSDHGVCVQAPPRLNLEKAENINPSISTYKTHHHLTVDFHLTQCIEFDDQSRKSPGSNISSSPSALSTTAATPSDYSNGLSNRDVIDQVCFGMVCLSLLEHSPRYTIGRM